MVGSSLVCWLNTHRGHGWSRLQESQYWPSQKTKTSSSPQDEWLPLALEYHFPIMIPSLRLSFHLPSFHPTSFLSSFLPFLFKVVFKSCFKIFIRLATNPAYSIGHLWTDHSLPFLASWYQDCRYVSPCLPHFLCAFYFSFFEDYIKFVAIFLLPFPSFWDYRHASSCCLLDPLTIMLVWHRVSMLPRLASCLIFLVLKLQVCATARSYPLAL